MERREGRGTPHPGRADPGRGVGTRRPNQDRLHNPVLEDRRGQLTQGGLIKDLTWLVFVRNNRVKWQFEHPITGWRGLVGH